MGMEQNKNIADILQEKTQKLAKELSGSQNTHRKKIADNIIGFIGGAGGTGTSTVVANVATALKQHGMSVLLIDLNICYPVQHIYFDVKQERDKKDFVSFISGRNQIGESIDYRKDVGVVVSNNRNINDDISCDNKITSSNLEECLIRMGSLFDIVLLDIPLNISHHLINRALYKCDTIYMIWDENIECISNFERIKNNLGYTGIEPRKIKVIMNKRTSIHYPKSVFKDLGIELIEIIPFELGVIESGFKAQVYITSGIPRNSRTSAEFTSAIDRIATKIAEIGGYVDGH